MAEDRLHELEKNFRRKKRNGTQLVWVKFNREARYRYDVVDAREDFEWMVSEIRRLREENALLREGLTSLRAELTREIDSLTQQRPPYALTSQTANFSAYEA
jgi:BMFP domain-containing protein YqiC